MLKLCSETVPDKLGNYLMRVRVEQENGTVSEKLVPMDVYLRILGDNSHLNTDAYISIPKLPGHYLAGKISMSGDGFSVLLYYPGERRAVKFADRHWNVPFPPLVFYFVAKNGHVAERRCFAVQSLEEEAQLYAYPFGNVSSEDGSICMGNIAARNVSGMEEVEDIVDDFFMSETNNDFYADSTATAYRQEELLSRLEKMDSFPTEWLKPCANWTMKKLYSTSLR